MLYRDFLILFDARHSYGIPVHIDASVRNYDLSSMYNFLNSEPGQLYLACEARLTTQL